MSLAKFQRCVVLANLHQNDRKWFPKWFKSYAQFTRASRGDAPLSERARDSETVEEVPVTEEKVIGYLRSLRGRGTPAWQRLQAARAIKLYQDMIRRTDDVQLAPIIDKLREISGRERGGTQDLGPSDLVAGEGNAGNIPREDPEIVRKMIGQLRLLHHPRSTERAYVDWVKRFIRHVDDVRLERYGETEIAVRSRSYWGTRMSKLR